MIAAAALLIPPLILSCFRERFFYSGGLPWHRRGLTYLVSVLALNWVMLLILCLMQNADQLVIKLNTYGDFACKYVALAVLIAFLEPFCESFLKSLLVRSKTETITLVPDVSKRKSHLDLLRIVAIYMVLFNHTGTNGFVLYLKARESVLYPFYLFNSIFIKIAVPLFFMITGALLLGRDEPIKKIVKDRFLKYAVVLVVSSMIAYDYYARMNQQKLSLTTFVKTLYSSKHAVALWYLYAYLAYLLMLPLLRKMAKNMTDAEYAWMFAMYGVINLLPILDFMIWKGTTWHNGTFSFFITTVYVFLPFDGVFRGASYKKRGF